MQFFHISPYGRKPRPGQPRHATAVGILGEAVRRPSSSTHIPLPAPPALIFGDEPAALFARLAHIEAVARDSAGRRLRSDAALMMVAVASYPCPVADPADPRKSADYKAWRRQVVNWLRRRFGPALACVLEHFDETYPHLHAVLFPTVTSGGQLDWTCHPGRAAKTASAQRGEPPGTQDACYRRAMARLQDNLHQEVSAAFGHERTGPRRERRDRHHHLEIKSADERIKSLEAQNRVLAAKLAALSSVPAKPDHEPLAVEVVIPAPGHDRDWQDPGRADRESDDHSLFFEDGAGADDQADADYDAMSHYGDGKEDCFEDFDSSVESDGLEEHDWDDAAEPDPEAASYHYDGDDTEIP